MINSMTRSRLENLNDSGNKETTDLKTKRTPVERTANGTPNRIKQTTGGTQTAAKRVAGGTQTTVKHPAGAAQNTTKRGASGQTFQSSNAASAKAQTKRTAVGSKTQAAHAASGAKAYALKRQQQNRQLIILSALLVAMVAAIIVIIVACNPSKSGSGMNDTAAEEHTSVTANSTDISPKDQIAGNDNDKTGDTLDYLSILGESYTAEEYLRAVAGGAEPQPERELEVIKEGPTDTRKIAITVDDLNEVGNLKTILNVANQYGGKLTLFAIGDNVDRKSDLRVTLKEAYMMGHEIENHTYDHAKLYSLNDSNMAYQIFATQKAVNNALGYEYQMHFIRMPGGNGEHDLRSHQYLYQLNDLGLADYKAIVNWTFSGSNGKIDEIKNSLKGGHIYLFHCKADDTKKLEEFIPYAVSQGYELVTLNEMLGYPENSISPLKGDALAYEIPEPYPYVYTNLVLLDGKPHSHRGQMYVVQLLQRRLIELGYLSKNAVVDGDFGNDTTIAVKLFQTYNDLDADGQAGPLTQKLLFSSNAKPNTSPYVAGEPDTYPEGGKIDLSVN